ncbi:MAG TPA: hypothetical protein PLE30_06930 [Candidatus Kapabacteria bacterium]|nr:hypothetical protein [Candidatus Kapabacteria bacterium]
MQKYILSIMALFLLLVSCDNSNSPEVVNYPIELRTAQTDVLSELDSLTKEMNEFADSLKTTDIQLNEEKVRARLLKFVDDYDYIDEALIMSDKGILNLIEPAKYKESEGTDVSSQEQIVRLIKEKKPVTSKIFKVVEGYYSIVYIIPVIVDGNIKVSIAVLIDPSRLFKPILEKISKDKDFTFFVIENTGMVLYDPDPSEIGLNTITDPYYQDYPEVVAACTKIANGEEGQTAYTFYNTGMSEMDKFDVYWKSIKFIDSDWKIVYKIEKAVAI